MDDMLEECGSLSRVRLFVDGAVLSGEKVCEYEKAS